MHLRFRDEQNHRNQMKTNYNDIWLVRCHQLILFFCRAFDHNGDGTISKEELKEAMQRFGHSFTEDECDEMFLQVWCNVLNKKPKMVFLP